MRKPIRLYTDEFYPLALTKAIIQYRNKKIVNYIDWKRSCRNYLVVHHEWVAKEITDMIVFFPEGDLFRVYTEDEMALRAAVN
ncbi:late expression factor 6 [Epinotia aporema granulovirus]|uniref:Late expression factor 6 n=1 Tax=Epinotia aporema granulovirus TaxID=166056 RepID=K4ERU6_9BBAC|nr:late expression factor 6 [Epinotia aporema granulovirus]AER41500.1 late expression factor 6 [Epinotia aporema granulovirus]